MKFEDFESGVLRENKKLKVVIGFGVIFCMVVLALVFLEKRFVIYQGGEIFKERLLAVDVCREGFMSMASGSPNKQFVSSGIMEILKKDPFEIDSPEILKLNSLEENKCRLIIKANKKLRSFIVELVGDKANPFYYKLNELSEEEAPEEAE
jgi:hypothetical protein